jgi:PPM family protein phosphatase
VDFIRATKTGRDLTWPFPFDPLLSVGANRLTVALRLANRRVHDMARANVDLDGMGTTIVAALIGSGRVAIGHVGDSRAYRLHDGKLDQLTRDDTWVAMLGREAEDEIANPAEHPLRHVLTSGIGMKEQVKPTLTELELVRGDQWLLCTDGVHGYVEEAALQQALAQPSAEAAADAVIAAASATTNDNATVIVFRLG